MANRRARVLVSFAGPFSNLVAAGLLSAASSVLWPSPVATVLFCLGALSFAAAFVTLDPFLFLDVDGYHILTDLLSLPALRDHARRLILGGLWRKLWRRERLRRDELYALGYGLVSLATVVALGLGAVLLVAGALRR